MAAKKKPKKVPPPAQREDPSTPIARVALEDSPEGADARQVLADIAEERDLGDQEERQAIRQPWSLTDVRPRMAADQIIRLRFRLPFVPPYDLLLQIFNRGVDDGRIRMTVDYDGGHAYNEWSGPLYDSISEYLEDGLRAGDLYPGEAVHEAMTDRLSEDDPGLLCVPEIINEIIRTLDPSGSGGNDGVVACGDPDEDGSCDSPEDAADYLSSFLQQLRDHSGPPDEVARRLHWFRADLIERYVASVRAGAPLPLPRFA